MAAVLEVVGKDKNCIHYEDPEHLVTLADFARRWPADCGIHALQAYVLLGGTDVQLLNTYLVHVNPSIRAGAIALNRNEVWLSTLGLGDPDCWCRAASIGALSRLQATMDLGALAKDRSAFVRLAFAEEAGKKSWRDAIPLLLDLLGDDRDFGTHSHEDDHRRYDVACGAAASLESMTENDAIAHRGAFPVGRKETPDFRRSGRVKRSVCFKGDSGGVRAGFSDGVVHGLRGMGSVICS